MAGATGVLSLTPIETRASVSHCRRGRAGYTGIMPKRTSSLDAEAVETADDLELIVHDKREGWRAGGAKARRRQRRYKNLLTRALVGMAPGAAVGDEDDAFEDSAQGLGASQSQ